MQVETCARSRTATGSRSASSGRTTTEKLPCVYYIHGGGMAIDVLLRRATTAPGARSSRTRASRWRWSISATALRASSAPEVAPFPAGLNDCVSGPEVGARQRGHAEHRSQAHRGRRRERRRQPHARHRAQAEADGDLGLIKGLYALCPYIAGQWPQEQYPSSTENNGILLDLHNNRGAMGYGIEAFNAQGSACLAGLRDRRRREGPAADRDQRQRVRSAARRGHRLLSPADDGRRRRRAAAR